MADDLDRFIFDFETAAGRIGARAAAAVRKATLDIEATAKRTAPVDTGNLRGSIGHDFTGDGRFGSFVGEVGPTADYGEFVERGTTRMAPQPYMAPALDRHGPELQAVLERLTAEEMGEE